jgi:hypothetical protein
METVPGQPPVRPPKPLDRDGMVAGAAAFGPGGELSRPGGLGYFTPPYREPPAGDGTKR